LDDDEEDDEDEQNPGGVVGQQQSGQIEGYEDGGHGANVSDGSRNQVNPFPNAIAAGMLVRVGRPEKEDDGLQEDADPNDDEEDGVVTVMPVPDPAQVEEPKQQADDGEDDGDVEKGAVPGQPHFLAADRRIGPHAAIKSDQQDVDAHKSDPGDQIRQDVGFQQRAPRPADALLRVAQTDAGGKIHRRRVGKWMLGIHRLGKLIHAHFRSRGDPQMRLFDVAQIQNLLLLPLRNSLPPEGASNALHVIFAPGLGDRVRIQSGVDVVFVAHVENFHAAQFFLLVAGVGIDALTEDGVVVAQSVVLGKAQRYPARRGRRQLEFDHIVADRLPTDVLVAHRFVEVLFASPEAAFAHAAFFHVEGTGFDSRPILGLRRRFGRHPRGKEEEVEEETRKEKRE